MSTSPSEILQHIHQEADYLLEQSMSVVRDAFLRDETLKRAFVRSIEIIGEAVKRLPDDLKLKYPTMEWRAIAFARPLSR